MDGDYKQKRFYLRHAGWLVQAVVLALNEFVPITTGPRAGAVPFCLMNKSQASSFYFILSPTNACLLCRRCIRWRCPSHTVVLAIAMLVPVPSYMAGALVRGRDVAAMLPILQAGLLRFRSCCSLCSHSSSK